MKNFLSFLLLSFFPLILLAQPSRTKYFEGIIEYDIKTESYMQGVSDNELRERIGATLRLYFKDGNYMREYIDGAGYTLHKLFYRKDKNMIYDFNPMMSPDSLYYTVATDSVYNSFDIKPGQPEKILECDCPSSVITAKYSASFLPDTGNITMTYFFCPQLPVDPAWHKDMYIWNDIIKIHKSISIKFIEEDPLFLKQTYTATKITWQPVDDSLFYIDPKLILVPMPKL
jgi:hypothetical protein